MYLMYTVKTMQGYFTYNYLHFCTLIFLLDLPEKPEKHCLFNLSLFCCIYFLLLLVIWLSVEKILSSEPIVVAKKES